MATFGVLNDDLIDWRHGASLPAQRPTTLPALIEACVAAHGQRPVLVDRGQASSWSDLARWSQRLAAAWSDRVAPGDRVAILAGNSLQHLLAELAAWQLGALAVPIFTGVGPPRIAELLAQVDPRVVVCADPACLPDGCSAVTIDEVDDIARSSGPLVQRAVRADAPCLVLFTSGSSGLPRGVTLSHDNLCSQQAAFAALWPEIGAGDRLAAYLPWHHSFGALAERLWSLARGAELTVVPGGGRDRDRLLATLRAVRPTVFMSVPKNHRLAVEHEAFAPGSLRWAFTAGAPLAAKTADWYAERGVPVYEGWGLTETSPSATITPPGEPRVHGVVGRPIPGVSVGVRARDGRILVRGPNVMLGYWRDPAATALRLVDGVIDTGDIGAWTAAGLRLEGRADHELKLANGEKVSAGELEAALQAQPGIVHALVVAEPDLVALIEQAPGFGAQAAAAAVAAVNAGRVLPYERIREVVLIDRPLRVEDGWLTASLKVARGEVLAAFRAWRAGQPGHFTRL